MVKKFGLLTHIFIILSKILLLERSKLINCVLGSKKQLKRMKYVLFLETSMPNQMKLHIEFLNSLVTEVLLCRLMELSQK